MKIGGSTVVTLDYELKLDDGQLIESTMEKEKPFVFYFGRSNVLPSFERALEGKEEGEELEVILSPDDAYGAIDEDAIYNVPRSQFSAYAELEVGSTMMMRTPEGERYPFRIIGLTDEEVTVDFNHPLAGKTLHFKVYIRGVRELTPDEVLDMASRERME